MKTATADRARRLIGLWGVAGESILSPIRDGQGRMQGASLRLLGSFELYAGSGQPVTVTSRKIKGLLAFLALNRGRPIARAAIADFLWEYSGTSHGRTSLRQALTVLKRALPGRRFPWLRVDAHELALDPARIAVDVLTFERHLAQRSITSRYQAAALYRGDLLTGLSVREDSFDAWLRSERDRLRHMALTCLTDILAAERGADDLHRAVATARRIIALDPTAEDAHRSLMQLYLALDQPNAALHQHAICKDLLWRELGVTPDSETTALYRAVQARRGTIKASLPEIPGRAKSRPASERYCPDSVVNQISPRSTAAQTYRSAPRVDVAEAQRAAVAVLPFINVLGSADIAPLCRGLYDDLMVALMAWRCFPIVARNSAADVYGSTRDANGLSRALDARYLVRGSLRCRDDQFRATLQLIEAASGYCLWASHFDCRSDLDFAGQENFARRIAAALMTEVERAERDRALKANRPSLDAWDYYQRGMRDLLRFSRTGNARARINFHKAIKLDDSSPQAFTGLAYSYHRDVYLGCAKSIVSCMEAQRAAAARAVELDGNDPLARWALGCAFTWMGQFESAISELERVRELGASIHLGPIALGWTCNIMGCTQRAIELIEDGLLLNPTDLRNHLYMTLLANSHLNARNYDEAERWARLAIRSRSDYADAHLVLTASLGHQGRRGYAAETLNWSKPSSLAKRRVWPLWDFYRRAADKEHALNGLRRAGMEI